jgi:deoxycytidylate deaminase
MIEYPYMPDGREILYVGEDNPFMAQAKKVREEYSMPGLTVSASVLVKDGEVIGEGSVGMGYHKEKGCERIAHNAPTGTGYDLCPGCYADNHGEAKAVQNAQESGKDVSGSDLYLYGHWWCCKPCWERMIAAGVRNVFLLEGSEVLFNKDHPNNVLK